jgi:hypothetical protein
MIERKIIKERMKEFKIQNFISESLQKVGYSKPKFKKHLSAKKL